MTSTVGPTAFVGLSHLGIIYAAAWAQRGAHVRAIDPEPGLAARLARGDLPIHEPGLSELLAGCGKRISFTDDLGALAECRLVVVCRDVPTDGRGESDLRPITDLLDRAGALLQPGATLVVMSQVPPGFTRALRSRLRTDHPELAVHVYYFVETLVFGDAVRRATQPERVIVGCADPAAPLTPALAESLTAFNCQILPMVYESAELAKTAVNLYLVSSVTCANMLADLCERVGADWWDIVPALRLDARIGPAAYIHPGLGVAGGNLERDLTTLRQLAELSNADSSYIDLLIELNQRRLGWVEAVLAERLFAVTAQPSVGIWGLTYKKNTHSTKNSPSLRLIRSLAGRARIRAWDPAVGNEVVGPGVEITADRDSVLDGVDCLLIMADWDEFAEVDPRVIRQRSRRALVIDCPGVLAPRRRELDGIEYVAMGLAAPRRSAHPLAGVAG